MVKGVSGNFLELITSNLLIGLKLGFNKKVLELKWEFLLAVGFGSSFDFSSFEKLYLELGLWWLKHQISKKIQNSKHQQYIKSLLISSKKLVSKNLVLKKLSSQELVLKSKKKAFPWNVLGFKLRSVNA